MFIEQLPSGKYRYQMLYVEERTGKKKRVSVALAKNTDKARREAEQILTEKIRQINASVSVGDIAFGDLSERFQKARAGSWRDSTAHRYHYSIKALCVALGADTLASKLSARYVQEKFAESGRTATSLNELLRTFKTVMIWAYKNDYVESAEWLRKLERYPEPTTKEKNAHKYLERDELQLLLPELKIELNRYLIAFLALSGLRIGEALALQKDDVDLSARVIRVTKTLDPLTEQISEGAKTYASNREVFIQDELYDLCRDIRKYMTKMSLACGFRSDLFFCDFEGKPLQYYRINKYFRENCERVLHRSMTLHSLRHSHASLMFEAGASLESVSLRLGHADSKVTRDIYLHYTDRKKEEYNQTFNRIKIL